MNYLTKQELADQLRVTVRTVTSYMQQGLLPQPMQLGRRLLWDQSQIAAHLQPKPVAVAPASRRKGRPRKAII